MKAQARRFLRESVVIFIAGAILSTAAEIAIGIPAQRYIGVLLIFVSLFILYTTVSLGVVHKRIEAQLDQFGLESFWIYEPAEARESFKKAAEIVRSARNRILIVSHYAPATASFAFPEARRDYLVQGIEQLIRSHLNDPTGQTFTYKRIIQSDRAKEAEGILRREVCEGDMQTFEHCSRVYNMLREKPVSNVEVEFFISEPIPSFPSMMIVDDKYVLFALTTKASKFPELDGGKTEFAGALFVEDHEGRRIRGFKTIFDRFLQDSSRIGGVEDSVTLMH